MLLTMKKLGKQGNIAKNLSKQAYITKNLNKKN